MKSKTNCGRDHVGGNEELKRRYGATVVGPAADRARIPAIDVALADGESWHLGSLEMRVIDVPGAPPAQGAVCVRCSMSSAPKGVVAHPGACSVCAALVC